MLVHEQRRTRQDDGINLLILPKLPDEKLGKITRVDELAKRFSCARDSEGCPVL